MYVVQVNSSDIDLENIWEYWKQKLSIVSNRNATNYAIDYIPVYVFSFSFFFSSLRNRSLYSKLSLELLISLNSKAWKCNYIVLLLFKILDSLNKRTKCIFFAWYCYLFEMLHIYTFVPYMHCFVPFFFLRISHTKNARIYAIHPLQFFMLLSKKAFSLMMFKPFCTKITDDKTHATRIEFNQSDSISCIVI